ncbi:MAG: tryptophan 2,3-dioxygenase family protein [Gemmatimonadota bacterium]
MPFGLPPAPGPNRLTYGSYLKVHDLIALQSTMSDPAQHDELLFIVIHQVYELWFKQLLHEVDEVITRLDADQPLGAQRLLKRCNEIERVLIQQLSVLETMTPNDFLTFRDHLMPASGFQSSQFRSLEFVSGAKEARHLEQYPEGEERDELERRLEAPSLNDSFYALLRRRGFLLPPGDEGHEQRVRELVRIYQEPDQHYDLYLLAEALVEYDEFFSLWRLHHVLMVERMIGSKPGTGGSEGVAYLRKTTNAKFFPELWELRSYLSAFESY